MASKDITLKIHIHSFILTKQFILLRVMEDPDPGILQVRLEYTLETLDVLQLQGPLFDHLSKMVYWLYTIVNGWECVFVCVYLFPPHTQCSRDMLQINHNPCRTLGTERVSH